MGLLNCDRGDERYSEAQSHSWRSLARAAALQVEHGAEVEKKGKGGRNATGVREGDGRYSSARPSEASMTDRKTRSSGRDIVIPVISPAQCRPGEAGADWFGGFGGYDRHTLLAEAGA